MGCWWPINSVFPRFTMSNGGKQVVDAYLATSSKDRKLPPTKTKHKGMPMTNQTDMLHTKPVTTSPFQLVKFVVRLALLATYFRIAFRWVCIVANPAMFRIRFITLNLADNLHSKKICIFSMKLECWVWT